MGKTLSKTAKEFQADRVKVCTTRYTLNQKVSMGDTKEDTTTEREAQKGKINACKKCIDRQHSFLDSVLWTDETKDELFGYAVLQLVNWQ